MPKISELPSGIPTTVDSLPLVQGSTTKKATFNDLPIAAATQTALNLKADAANTSLTGTANANNLVVAGTLSGAGVTKAAVGLGNVDNTSDVNKPVSTAQTAALLTATFDRVGGLAGSPNTTTPLTKYDLQAAAVTLRNTTGAPVTRLNTATITCDLGLAGSSANGRDQAGAFTTSSWIYLYFIWNGTTLATLASTTVPASFTGSTLPSGYTHWAFATAIRWNGSSNIIPVYTRGCHVYYDDESVTNVLTSGVATAFTLVSCASFVPPVALRAQIVFGLLLNATGNAGYTLNVRATGSGSTTGRLVVRVIEPGGNLSGYSANTHEMPLGTSQSFDYKISGVPGGGGAIVNVAGYYVPNGDV